MSENLLIRRANKNDVRPIAELEKECFRFPWSERSFFEEITQNKVARYAVAERADEIVGYAGIWIVSNEGHITNVAVNPDSRRKGIARGLFAFLFDISQREGVNMYTLEVRVSNEEAIALYKGLNFIECGIRREYYDDTGEDALIMWKDREWSNEGR